MPIERCEWRGAPALKLSTPGLELVAVYGYGPRIASLSLPGGDNLLFWAANPEQYKRDMPAKGEWYLRGGHRCWVARPGADECEETYAPDNKPASCEVLTNGFELMGDRCPITGTRKGFRVTVLDEQTIEVDNLILNEGPMLYSAAAWGLTCTKPSDKTRYIVPLGDNSEWDTATVVMFRKWAGGNGQNFFNDDQFSCIEDALLIDPKGRENKRMIQSGAGAIVMSDAKRGLSFGIQVEVDDQGRYPMGCNIASYIGKDNFMVEMETMGPEFSLKPGVMIHHVERWRLAKGAIEATGKAARSFMQ